MELKLDDPETTKIITKGIPLEKLELRLRPTQFAEKNPAIKIDGWTDHSGGGFLGSKEGLIETILEDYHAIKRLGKTYDELAEACRIILMQPAKKYLKKAGKEFIKLQYNKKRFMFQSISSCGFQSCPWGCEDGGTGHIYIEDLKNPQPVKQKYEPKFIEFLGDDKKTEKLWQEIGIEQTGFDGFERFLYLINFLTITDLTPHLISEHYFFQGKGSAYRTDPERLVEFLDSVKK